MTQPTPGASAERQVTYRWTGDRKQVDTKGANLSVACIECSYRRTMSWTGDNNTDSEAECRQPTTTRARSNAASPTRVRFLYEDEDVKARICGNVQRLLDDVQKDPEAVTTSAQVARKVLKYRRLNLDDVNLEDPDFDASAFFGIEWRRIGHCKRSHSS